MILSNLVAATRDRLARRRRYNRLVTEIQSLSARDLADLGADRGEMLHHAYKDVYG